MTRRVGDCAKRELLDRVLRVDLAGEFGAKRIYEGQLAVLGSGPGSAEVRQMYEQELAHLEKMRELAVRHRVRPSLLSPLWTVGAWGVGAASALLGKEAAMACTVAVETEIAQHYNDQLREMMARMPGEYEEIEQTIRSFRDDELRHHDEAVAHGAAQAPGYRALVGAIRFVTRTAVKVAERV